jgi:membrane-associated phospholipid phosphatase
MEYIYNIARASDIIQIFILYFLYYFTFDVEFLIFCIGFYINFEVNNILKYNIFLKIFEKKNILFLGKGTRPDGAKNCCPFKPCHPIYPKYPKSYGMPSGHSQSIAYFSSIIIMYLFNNNYINNTSKYFISSILIFFTIFVMYTRVLFKCHTIQQTIIGSIIGAIFGYILFKNKDKLKNKIKKNNNYELVLLFIATIVSILIYKNTI